MRRMKSRPYTRTTEQRSLLLGRLLDRCRAVLLGGALSLSLSLSFSFFAPFPSAVAMKNMQEEQSDQPVWLTWRPGVLVEKKDELNTGVAYVDSARDLRQQGLLQQARSELLKAGVIFNGNLSGLALIIEQLKAFPPHLATSYDMIFFSKTLSRGALKTRTENIAEFLRIHRIIRTLGKTFHETGILCDEVLANRSFLQGGCFPSFQ